MGQKWLVRSLQEKALLKVLKWLHTERTANENLKNKQKNPQNKQLQSRQATRIELVSVSTEHQRSSMNLMESH